jgi:hypothetical protein
VSISIKGTRVSYKADGFRIVVPSEHIVNGREFAAELQIVHGKLAGSDVEAADQISPSPSVLVLGIWIDSGTNSTSTLESREALEEFLVEWQEAVDWLEASCNRTGADAPGETGAPTETQSVTTAVGPPSAGVFVPAVVGRGDEHNFANDPIRRLYRRRRNLGDTIRTPYDWWDGGSSSFYSYEHTAAVETCNETVLWNLAEHPLEISHARLATLQTLLQSYKNASCHTQVPESPLKSTDPFRTRVAEGITKVCPYNSDDETTSSTASSLPVFCTLLGAIAVTAWMATPFV